MTMANDIITEMDLLFPHSLSMGWDMTQGLIVGDASKSISNVIVSLEFRDNIKDEDADMIILHHPPIFGPDREVTNPFYRSWKKNDIVVYAIHSRMDRSGFTSQAIVEKLFEKTEYANLKILDDGTAIINLDEQTDIDNLIKKTKSRLKLNSVNAIIKKRMVKKIAIHGGEAFQLHHISDAMKEDIDLYMGGDMSHHLAERTYEFEASFIDIGHFSEQEGMRKLGEILQTKFPEISFRYIEQPQLWEIK